METRKEEAKITTVQTLASGTDRVIEEESQGSKVFRRERIRL